MARKRKQRRYSDQERAEALAALAANNGNLSHTARQLGIPRATLEAWAKQKRHAEAAENVAPEKEALADRLEILAGKLLDGVTEEKIAVSGPKELLTSLGIAVDKMQLLRGQPTSINDTTHRADLSRLSDEELDTLERLAARAAESGSHPG